MTDALDRDGLNRLRRAGLVHLTGGVDLGRFRSPARTLGPVPIPRKRRHVLRLKSGDDRV